MTIKINRRMMMAGGAAAMALGSIAVPGLIAVVGVRGTVIAVAAIPRCSRSCAGPLCVHWRSARRSIKSASGCFATTRSSLRCRWTPWSALATAAGSFRAITTPIGPVRCGRSEASEEPSMATRASRFLTTR